MPGAGEGLSRPAPGGDLVDDLLRARGCMPEHLARERDPTIRAFMPDPALFRDMERAADRLAAAVIDQETVTIFGDYDVDGATSAALLLRLLRDLGLEAGVYIPDRLMEGYGPSGEALVALARAGSSLVVTVDCGAQAFAALEAAREAGLDVIVVAITNARAPSPSPMRWSIPIVSTSATRAPPTAISPPSGSPSCLARR